MSEKESPREILQSIPWFGDLDPEHFEKLVRISSVHNLLENEDVFREGDRQDKLYIVVEGRVALEIFIPHQGRVRILTAEEMDVIGWSAVTPGLRTRTASAKAVIPSCLIGIDSEELRQLSKEDYEFGYIIMRRIAHIIASRLMVTRLQLLDMFASPNEDYS